MNGTFFTSSHPMDDHPIPEIHFLRHKLNQHNTSYDDGFNAINQAFTVLEAAFFNIALYRKLFKDFIAPALESCLQYLEITTHLIIQKHPALFDLLVDFVGRMSVENPLVLNSLADIAFHIAHRWRPECNMVKLNKQKESIETTIRMNFDTSMKPQYIFARQRSKKYVERVIIAQGDIDQVRARAKRKILNVFIKEHQDFIEKDIKAPQARMVQRMLHHYLVTPRVLDSILQKNETDFMAALLRMLEWHLDTFCFTVFDSVLRNVNGVRGCSDDAVNFLFALPGLKQLRFITFDYDQYIPIPDASTVFRLREIIRTDDMLLNTLFFVNRSLGMKEVPYPLFCALTRLNNYNGLEHGIACLLTDPAFKIRDYYQSSSAAFKLIPAALQALHVATMELLEVDVSPAKMMTMGG